MVTRSFKVTVMGTLAKYSVALIAYAAGGLTNAWLVASGAPQSMAARWLVAFGVGYLVFVLLVRLYCHANAPVRHFRERRRWFDGWDGLDVATRAAGDCSRSSEAVLRGDGGQFGGGGATSSFDAPLSPQPLPISSGSNLPFDIPAVDEGVGAAIAIVIAIALVALALGLGASLLYVLWQMPALLADAVAGAAVVGLASRRAEGWWGAVMRHTWKPVLISVLSLVVTGTALHLAVPQAHTVSEVLAAVRRGEVHLASSKQNGAPSARAVPRKRGRGAS